MSENPYAPPKTDVGHGGVDPDERPKPSAGARFLWTAAIGTPVFFSFVLMSPRAGWAMGAIGSVIFGCLSGLVALCIPVRSKPLFIAPSILIFIVIAVIIGSST